MINQEAFTPTVEGDDALEAENAKLREQVDVLTTALAEAMVICAKWSPNGLNAMRQYLGLRA